jgi:hypothetical protein
MKLTGNGSKYANYGHERDVTSTYGSETCVVRRKY